MRWDRERVADIVGEMLDNPDRVGIYPTTDCYNRLENLLSEVRNEAIRWAWEQAAAQYNQGRDPRRTPITELQDKASDDLNPERREL